MTPQEPELETMRAMISGYLDGELDPAERAQFEAYAAAHPDFRKELDEMRGFVQQTDLRPPAIAEEDWEKFLDNVYNRIERRLGWMLTIVGASALLALALYFVVVLPWAPAPVKIAADVLLAGLGVLFLSVLRERIVARKTDRYSRDVKR
jgi:anti-sigma factor RsiW